MTSRRPANFPDTAEGAKDFLRSESSLPKREIKKAKCIADPSFDGVWMVDASPAWKAIVYLNAMNGEGDFEVGDGDAR